MSVGTAPYILLQRQMSATAPAPGSGYAGAAVRGPVRGEAVRTLAFFALNACSAFSHSLRALEISFLTRPA